MNNITQPAYPVMPLQDNFKRLVVPVAGINKLELFALKMYEIYFNDDGYNVIANHEFENENGEEVKHAIMNFAIDDAITFLNKIEEKTKTINNDKNNEMAVFDR
jgi:hypothetical protein